MADAVAEAESVRIGHGVSRALSGQLGPINRRETIMQKFTSGDVTVSIEIERFMPNVGEMGGYRCDFVWWLEIDGVEYVSGESTHTDVWWTSVTSGDEGWAFDDAMAAVGGVPDKTELDVGDAVAEVLDWFGALRDYGVGLWFDQSRGIAERANESGLLRGHNDVMFVGSSMAAAWAVCDSNGDPVPDVFYSTREEAEAAAAMQDV